MAQWVKNSPVGAGDTEDMSLIPGSGRSPGEGNGNPLQYSRLENFMGRGVWGAIVRGVVKSWSRLSTHTKYGTYLNSEIKQSGMSWEIGIDVNTWLILYIKQVTDKNLCAAQGTQLSALWRPIWEGNLKKRGHLCMCGWFPLLYCGNQHNTVKQLSSNKKLPKKFKNSN